MALSIAIPASERFAPFLRRTLQAIRNQFDGDVVVGIDGDDSIKEVSAVCDEHDVQWWPSHRPESAHLPHKNSARNAAVAHSTGDFIWVIDADTVPGPGCIETLSSALVERHHVALPCIFQELQNGVVAPYTYSAYADHYDANAPPVRIRPPWENFPAFHRDAFEALTGFYPRYIGWGGNKEDFVRRLGALTGIEFWLCPSAYVTQQWHPPSENHNSRRNKNIFRARMGDVRDGAGWWQKQLDTWLMGQTPPPPCSS